MARVCILLLFYVILAKTSLEDLLEKKIKNRSVWLIMVLAMAAVVVIPEIGVGNRLAGMFLISVPMTILALIFPGSFGGGDIKLVAACGALLGMRLVLKGTIYAVFIGAVCSLWIVFCRKEKTNFQFPFGPCLSIGFIVVSLELF